MAASDLNEYFSDGRGIMYSRSPAPTEEELARLHKAFANVGGEFFEKVATGDLEGVTEMVENGQNMEWLSAHYYPQYSHISLEHSIATNKTALAVAMMLRNPEMIVLLLTLAKEKGFDLFKQRLWNPGIYASVLHSVQETVGPSCGRFGPPSWYVDPTLTDVELVKLLLEWGATPIVEGLKAYSADALEGYAEVVEALLSKSDANITDEFGTTAIHMACSSNHRRAVEVLLDHGADPNHKDIFGRTALFRAIKYGYWPIVKLLLERGADPMIEYGGRTSVEVACQFAQSPQYTRLLNRENSPYSKKGIDWVKVVSILQQYKVPSSKFALNKAVLLRHPEIVSMLVEKGVDCEAAILTATEGKADEEKTLAWKYLSVASKLYAIERIAEYDEVLDILKNDKQ